LESVTLAEVVQATQGKEGAGLTVEALIQGVSTDSRTLRAGELFVALKGKNFDGHAYVEDALNIGSPAAVVKKGWKPSAFRYEDRLIRVGDTLKALGDLAEAYRLRFKVKVVGVTGTNGKTTTKEMIAAILQARYQVLKSEGNLNNQIGVPLTLFRLASRDEVGVTEFGMSAPGEIARLCAIAHPSVGVITNVGPAHLETMGTVERVADAKAEILKALDENGNGVVNGDEPLILERCRGLRAKVVTFGFGKECDVKPDRVFPLGDGASGFDIGKVTIRLSIPGRQNITNALAALAVGGILGIPGDEAGKALEALASPKMRMEKIMIGESLVLNDSYNANPASMSAAIDTLAEVFASRRIAVLGDMLELGPISRDAHFDVGRKAAARGIDVLIAVGERAKGIAEAARVSGLSHSQACATTREAALVLKEIMKPGDAILVKGSRAMNMEAIVDALCENGK
jgi:UDP-N-acetylmuramoyl-tripeptide--D-alanyl-D-alanine ligase